ncbi:maltose alpha-D-glucosyltransferase/alpha-amylase [Propionicimonas paludicola]|uniref:Maltose alpha-D-glucosyltransferase/alpha-amylase n=1 Tax=Propionicimonas paludicola TaxID=185243 RepID=A0A2A9CTL9_9ACTN|nr:maltose alpha-D-glucosyltransferase [Propionicimonas paludicola]PFG17405.1 maltose alpha-D-glucosyltransferase/alpha-amylase [Propionicimonas paludicola]
MIRAEGPSARPRVQRRPPVFTEPDGPAQADNPAYLAWLEGQSMLRDATDLSRQLAGHPALWTKSFARPDPRRAVQRAGVWFTAYPLSQITADGQSFLGALGDPALWEVFARIGIQAVHTGPLKSSGGIRGWAHTPSIDGSFDRISMSIDPAFGTDAEFRDLCATAATNGATVIDDIIPGHTGKGADFRLAEQGYADYPGIYHLIELPRETWSWLPPLAEGADSVNLDPDTEARLAEAGYLIGALQRVIFFEPGIKDTNWSVTGEVMGVDGVVRRWAYLHYFKDGQPSINWLDPSLAGPRLILGDAVHSLLELGSGGLRLDANGFLGLEPTEDGPAWSEGHPLSRAANQLIGSMVRKLGGFTFQELNLGIDDIRATGADGPDLSYDFVTRPAYQLALCTGDTEFLRLTLAEARAIGIDQASLVHALQNHDELTYELVHFEHNRADDHYRLSGQEFRGRELAEHVRQQLRDVLLGPGIGYNARFVENGIACTTASVIAAGLGITDLDAIGPSQAELIRRAHLLACRFNAWQPGVFALSGWDLVGALPLASAQVDDLVADGDTRWLERGAYDLLGTNPDATASSSGLPRARSLYGPLPDQLADPASFASQLAGILDVRRESGVATGELVDVPEPPHPGLLVLLSRTEHGTMLAAVLNFTAGPQSLDLTELPGFPPGHYSSLSGGDDSYFVPALPTESSPEPATTVVNLDPFGGVLLRRA